MEVKAGDGVSLRVAHWRPTERRVRGTVCILQGRAEFIERYFETIIDLRRRGFAVVAFDWRGQGGSGREIDNPKKGHVRDFSRYRLDLEAVRAQVLEPLMPKPHFALAHSMGGAIALWAAREGWLPFERLVATAPMIELCLVRVTRMTRTSARLLRWLGLGKSFIPGGGETSLATKPFEGNRLTGDARRYARNAALATAMGEGAIGDPTIAWTDAAFRLMGRLQDPRFALAVRTPTLIVAAGADPICATPAIERFAARLKAGHAIVLPGSRHEILMENDVIRSEFWAAFDAFVPGTPDPSWSRSSVEKAEHGLMEAAVAGGDD
ncbi:MAG TPA: alpha/beta hydrolase [Beijerinckiaceae bacterium]|nr:alpha/beta hydrolase [Beijerinckiaceae bacterium]